MLPDPKPLSLLSFIALIIFLPACMSEKRILKEQVELHREFYQHQLNIMKTAEDNIDRYASLLTKQYRLSKNCRFNPESNSKSSIYIPRSGKKGAVLNCILSAAAPLDKEWENYYSSTDCISWLYLYDNNARVLKLFPKTDTYALFGDDLTFEKFQFFIGPIQTYPKGVWSQTRIDVNGTGRIFIHSKALKLPGLREYAVVSVDIRTSQILRIFEPRFFDFAKKHSLPHVFFYGYHISRETGPIAYEFSTDLSKWRTLMPSHGATLRMNPKEALSFSELAHKAQSTTDSPVQEKLEIDGASYLCSMMYFPKIDLNTVMCSEV